MEISVTIQKYMAKWMRRVGALIVWSYFIYLLTPLHRAFPPPMAIQIIYTTELRWVRYLCYLLVALIVHRRFGIKAFVYIGTFPIWAPAMLLWNGLKTAAFAMGIVFKFLGINVKIFNTARTRKAGAACYVLMPLCYIAIHDSTNMHVVYVSVVVLVLLSFRIIYGVFCWAMRPLALLSEILEKLKVQFGKEVSVEIEKVKEAQERRDFKSIKKKLETEENLAKALGWLQRVLLTPQKLLGLFFIVLAFSVVLIITNYAIAYWGLNKIDEQHFRAAAGERGFGDFVYFGLMVMTTSDLSNIAPISTFARTLVASQIICSVLLLSMLVLAFSTSASTEVGEAASSLKDLLTTRKPLHSTLRDIEIIEDAEVEEVESGNDDRGES